MIVNANALRPGSAGGLNLGSAGTPWGGIYGQALSIDDAITDTGTVTTVGTGFNTAFTIAIDDESAYHIEHYAVGVDKAGTMVEVSAHARAGLVYRDGGAAPVIVNQALIHNDIFKTTNTLSQIAVSGNNIVVQVQGAVGVTMSWKVLVRYRKIA